MSFFIVRFNNSNILIYRVLEKSPFREPLEDLFLLKAHADDAHKALKQIKLSSRVVE